MKEEDIWTKVCKKCGSEYPNHTEDCEFHPNKERVIGVHDGCGGNIIKKEQCTWCDKCKQYFCGCACG